jgi:hypothetical protein
MNLKRTNGARVGPLWLRVVQKAPRPLGFHQDNPERPGGAGMEHCVLEKETVAKASDQKEHTSLGSSMS